MIRLANENQTCPKCGRDDRLEVGNFPLRCQACGWCYLNENPCEVCGEPSVSMMGGLKKTHYRCRAHAFSYGEMVNSLRGSLGLFVDV